MTWGLVNNGIISWQPCDWTLNCSLIKNWHTVSSAFVTYVNIRWLTERCRHSSEPQYVERSLCEGFHRHINYSYLWHPIFYKATISWFSLPLRWPQNETHQTFKAEKKGGCLCLKLVLIEGGPVIFSLGTNCSIILSSFNSWWGCGMKVWLNWSTAACKNVPLFVQSKLFVPFNQVAALEKSKCIWDHQEFLGSSQSTRAVSKMSSYE